MEDASGQARSPRRKLNASSDNGGEARGSSQSLSGSPRGLTKFQQTQQRKKQQAAHMVILRRSAAVESCSATPPRLSTEFGSPSSSNGSMASRSERPQHGGPGGWTKEHQKKQQRARVLAMNRARSRAAVGSRSSTLPILSLELLDESDEMDDSGESTSVCESSKPEASSSSSTSDGSSDETVGDDDTPGEGDDDDEREGEGGYDDDEEEVSGGNSEDQAGGEDIEDVSFICLFQILYLPHPTHVPTPPLYHRINTQVIMR